MTPPGFDADETDGADSARSGSGSADAAPLFARGDDGSADAAPLFARGDHGSAGAAPLFARGDHGSPSVFRPENMLREARRQKGLELGGVAPVCILDPDGDLVRLVRRTRAARRSAHWACYHTEMWEWAEDGQRFGIVGCAVGASFAVLVAEQLFVSGCRLLISVASAGQIADLGKPPYYILIERALRDEGTSYHYLPASEYAGIDAQLLPVIEQVAKEAKITVHRGATWTTDAPFRETAEAIDKRRGQGILAVEMEAAALYAFARARSKPVICLAHVTNQLGCVDGDFEKGEANGADGSLTLVRGLSNRWRRTAGINHGD
jgi:uridine phosphorylase